LVQIQPPLPVNEIRTGALAPFLFLEI